MPSGLVVLFLVILLLFFVVTGWTLFFGWIFSLIFDLTLFEGALLAALNTATVSYIFSKLNASVSTLTDEAFDLETELTPPIPPERFFKSEADQTRGNWYRYQTANNIYDELQANTHLAGIGMMNHQQLQELAIRLTDITVSSLKQKPSTNKKIALRLSDLQSEMKKMDQQPYDDDILRLALNVVNVDLSMGTLPEIIRRNLWDQRIDS